jgi:putative FmdB family regulatory protein
MLLRGECRRSYRGPPAVVPRLGKGMLCARSMETSKRVRKPEPLIKGARILLRHPSKQDIVWLTKSTEPPMPIYEYRCKKCDKSFTLTMSISEHEKKTARCPECKSTKVVPQYQPFFAKTSRKS